MTSKELETLLKQMLERINVVEQKIDEALKTNPMKEIQDNPFYYKSFPDTSFFHSTDSICLKPSWDE